MSTENKLQAIGYEIAEDMTLNQYRFVVLTSTKTVRLPDAIGERAEGVLQDAPEIAGQGGTVMVHGYSKVEAGEALAVGDLVGPEYVSASDAGKAVKTGLNGNIRGRVTEAAAAEGDLATIFLINPVGGSESMIGYSPANAGDTDVIFPLFRARRKIRILTCYYMPQADVTGADTNFLTPTVINAGTDGNGTDVISSLALTSGVDVDAMEAQVLTNSVTPADLIVEAGEVVSYLSNMTGSSVFDDPQRQVQVDYQYID